MLNESPKASLEVLLNGMRNQGGSWLWSMRFFCVFNYFSFWHLFYFWEASFAHLLHLILLTWVKTNLSRFFFFTENYFNTNFKAMVLNPSLCFRQTDFLFPTTSQVDLSVWFGLLEVLCYMTWRYCVDRSVCIRLGALQNEWPSVSFLGLPFKANLL